MLIGDNFAVRRQVVLLTAGLVVTLVLLVIQIGRLFGAGDDPASIPMPPLTKQKVHAVGSEASWFGADTYPPGARRRGEQGRVQMRIGIDEAGRVRACEIEVSSGSRDLDGTSCALFQRRGRYETVVGADGRSMPVSFRQSVRWVLDGPPPAAPRG